MNIGHETVTLHVASGREGDEQWCSRLQEYTPLVYREMRPGMHLVSGSLPEAGTALVFESPALMLCLKVNGFPGGDGRVAQIHLELARQMRLTPEEARLGAVVFINTLEATRAFAGQYVPSCSLLPWDDLGEVRLDHPVSPLAELVLQEMFSGERPPMLERLTLEKGWLQVMAIEMEYLAANWPNMADRKQELFLDKADMTQLETARSILVENLSSPPDMKSLSRQVGMNHYKFKKGFKQMFGQPPMTYLRNYRMEVAKELLAGGAMTVTQVALEVGYSNPSAFSARFTEYFGHNPKKYK